MGEHASDLRLDELAAGMEVGEGTRAHVAGCQECSARLRQIETARARAKEMPGFHRVKARVRALSERRRWTWAVFAAPAVAVALVLVLVVVRPGAEPGTRVKGGFSIAAVTADGREVQRARPGDRLNLAIGAAGRSEVLVLGVDDRGAVEVMWPPMAPRSVQAPPGARAVLQPPFEITPGSFALYALFADAPIPAGPAKEALAAEVQAAQAVGKSPLDARAPSGPWDGTAKLVLEVTP